MAVKKKKKMQDAGLYEHILTLQVETVRTEQKILNKGIDFKNKITKQVRHNTFVLNQKSTRKLRLNLN